MENNNENLKNSNSENSSFFEQKVSSSNGLEGCCPTLRFPNFTKDWSFYKAEKLFENIAEKNHPNITVLTIIQGKGTIPRSASGRKIQYEKESLTNYKKVNKNDFIIHLRSFEGGLEIANSEGIVSPAYSILRNKQEIAPLFYNAYFHTNKFINSNLSKTVEGIRDGRQISYNAFRWLPIPYPEINEQQKIADFLSLIDQRIEKQRQLVESLKKYKRGLLFSIFTSIQASVKLEQISTYHSSNLTLEASQTKGDFALYDANGICSNIDTYMHDTDYVAIIKDGSGVGKLQYCKQKSSHIGTLGSLTSQSCSPYYLYTALQIIDFTKYITGMAIPHIYYKDYKKCDIPYPDRNSQNLIENTFKSIDKIITKSILNLEKLKLLKAGLLQQMFI